MSIKNIFYRIVLVFSVSGFGVVQAKESLKDTLRDGTVSGNIRAYYNTREYETREDEAAFALGGALRAQSGSFGSISLGLGYYTAQDLDTNSSDPAKVNGRLGSELEVLAEAYIKFEQGKNKGYLGRHIINTPLANAGDAFIVPFAFQGYTFISTALDGFTFQANYLNEIKNRNSADFVDVGIWNSQRFGIAEPTSTSGTLNLGAAYKAESLMIEAWYTSVAEFFNSIYANAAFSFGEMGALKPFVGVQLATQSETGDELLGTVDSMLYGIKAGAGFGASKLTLAFNSVDEAEDAFRNGAFLAPYNFSTSPLFTNNMLQTFENVDAGDAYKVTFNHNFGSSIALKLSYASFDFINATDRDATDFDITYKFSDYLSGLSLRWRIEIVSSDTDSVEQTNHRFQTQFVF